MFSLIDSLRVLRRDRHVSRRLRRATPQVEGLEKIIALTSLTPSFAPLMNEVPMEKAPMAKMGPMVIQGQVRGLSPNGQQVAPDAVIQGGLLIAQGQVRGTSYNGQPVATGVIHEGGFKPGTPAHIVITGWSFIFRSGDHPILQEGMWLQTVTTTGDWVWAQEVTVQADGYVTARYYTFAGSENQDNPFDVLINYAVFGQPR